jgi:protoporphyrinogen oxidase
VLCCEITCRWDDEHWNLDLQRGFEIAERDLVTVGLIKQGVARPLDIAKVRYAYPVYDLTYKANLDVLKKTARKVRNFQTTGRQGLYRYNNMDHSIAMGRKIAKTLAEGRDANAESVAAGKEYFG